MNRGVRLGLMIAGTFLLHVIATASAQVWSFLCFKKQTLICDLAPYAGYLMLLPLGPFFGANSVEPVPNPGHAFYFGNSFLASIAIVAIWLGVKALRRPPRQQGADDSNGAA